MNNPASRVLEIVRQFQSSGAKATMSSRWQEILGVPNSETSQEEVWTSANAFLGEIRLTESRLQVIGVEKQLYGTTMSRLRNVFAPTALNSQWQQLRDSLGIENTLTTLGWASWSMSKFDEPDIDADSLNKLVEALTEQEQLLASTELPVGLRDMLERHVVSLRAALRLYKIQGAAPLQRAVHEAYAEFHTAPMELAEEVENGPSRAREVLQNGAKLVGKAAELADKGSKIMKFGKEIYELGMNGFHLGQTLLSNSPSIPGISV